MRASKNLKFLHVVAGTALFLIIATAQAQQGGCNCSDARDLFTRYCAARGAVNEWNSLISRARSKEHFNGKVIPALDAKDQVAQCVDEVVNIYRQEGPGSRKSGGATDRNCEVTIDAPNACMRGVIAHHESWHKMMCEAHYKPDAEWRSSINPFTYLPALINRMSQQSIVDYMLEERTGYMLETNYTRDRLEELAGQCNEPQVFKPARGGRSFTIQDCPRPDYANYNRKCSFK